MLMIIDTKRATHIAISIPAENAATSLPAITQMFENNAVFLNNGWNEISLLNPDISIKLGNVFKSDNGDYELLIKSSDSVVESKYEALAPDIFFSYQKKIDELKGKISRLENQNRALKDEIEEIKRSKNDDDDNDN